MSYKSNLDQRRYLRYDLLDYAMAYADNDICGIRTVIADVGLGGLNLRTHEPFEVGDRLRIVIGRGTGEGLAIRAIVRHVHVNDESRLYATGVQFQPETHQERIAIAQYVHEVFQRRCDVIASNPA